MPVLPLVGSRIVWPGAMRPLSSASSMSARATRSLTEPVGLNDSILAQMRTPGLGLSRLSSTSGVLPIAWTRSPYRPPHGRFCRGGTVTSKRIVKAGARAAPAFTARRRLRLESLLERCGGLEARRLGRGDLDRLAGLRVAALARGALRHAELAEAGQADLVAAGQLVGDLVQRGLDGLFGLTIAQTGLLCDGLRQRVLVDGAHVCSSSWVEIDRRDGTRRPGRNRVGTRFFAAGEASGSANAHRPSPAG